MVIKPTKTDRTITVDTSESPCLYVKIAGRTVYLDASLLDTDGLIVEVDSVERLDTSRLVIFDEQRGQLHGVDELAWSVNGDAIQITVPSI